MCGDGNHRRQKSELLSLPRHDFRNLRTAMSVMGNYGAGRAVDKLAAGIIIQINALAANESRKFFMCIARKKSFCHGCPILAFVSTLYSFSMHHSDFERQISRR